jgi:glycosyltransferase involved in cell wall biosynthesis
MTSSVLSYFKSYFNPGSHARFANHSTGQIASHIYTILREYGSVLYLGSKERPQGLQADLFIGHFWAFAELCRSNSFRTTIAFYSVSDPRKTRELMGRLAKEYDVPEPLFDLPPESFDHEATMGAADLVLVVGNSYTLATFPAEWHHKIRMINYSVDTALYDRSIAETPRNEFCYVATYCGLRKGFMDVLRTWQDIDKRVTTLHTIGHLDPPWDRLLDEYNSGSIVHHGWIDSHTTEYLQIIKSCKFAYIPTYSEGQMGSLLEVIHSGCIPITTRASGIDDRVLEHCVVVDPFDTAQHKRAIHDMLSWSDDRYQGTKARLIAATRAHQNWEVFETGVRAAIAEFSAQR